MFRLSMLVLMMMLITHTPESMDSLYAYKDYIMAILLSLLVKPWVEDQFE